MTKLPKYICFRTTLLNDFKVKLERVEPEEVAEALRPIRRAKWKSSCNGWSAFCSACGEDLPGRVMTPFCPMCGADMRDIEDKEPVDRFEGWSDELKQTYRELLEKLNLLDGNAE